MKTKLLITSLVVASSLLLVQPTIAAVDSEHNVEHSGKDFKHKGMFKKMRKLARILELDDTQKEKIKAIMEQAREDRGENKELRSAYRDQVKALMEEPIFDDAAFLSLHAQHQSEFADAALQRAKTRHAMMQVLTQEQRDKLATLKQGRRAGLLN